MVTKEGVVKLIDFGLTVPYTPDFCRPGNRTGTANYLAPEIIKRQTTDHRVDLFALGVTAYETVHRPAALGAIAVERRDAAPTPQHAAPRSERPQPDLDDDLCAVLRKAIAREPADRYASAAALKQALEGLERADY